MKTLPCRRGQRGVCESLVFEQAFKATCGVNFQDYLTSVRIDKAKALLRDADMPCSTISQMVG